MSWYATPQACHSPGSLRSMLTSIPLNFAEECSLERKNSASKAAEGVFCSEGPCHFAFFAQTSLDVLHPAVDPWQAGAGNPCGDAHPTCVYGISGEGERGFVPGLCPTPDPEDYCSASFMLYRDIASETLEPLLLPCQILQNPTTNPSTSGNTLVNSS